MRCYTLESRGALKALRGQLSARQVFEQLVGATPAAGVTGVEPFHPPAEAAITVGGKRVGKVQVDAEGQVHAVIEAGQLPPQGAAALAEAIAAHLSDVSQAR
mgnify:FL=1